MAKAKQPPAKDSPIHPEHTKRAGSSTDRNDVEYRLIVTPHFNERKQARTTRVTIETTKVFASFRYELSVKETVKGRQLTYKILGLKAPQLDLPSSGSARFEREYDGFNGRYEIIVECLDGSKNAFEINVTPKQIKMLKSPKTTFIEPVIA